jgi:catechol 2,3-dioxygenase-like lactoylglutathione lyase family enzyme
MPQTTITEVRTVAITVRDQDQALGFYVDTLGFEKRLDAPFSPTMRWVEVAPPGAATSVALVANDPDAGAQPGTDTGIRFIVPNADVEHAWMREVGVVVSDVMRWEGVPPMYTVDDLDGNRFYIVEEIR